MLNADASMLSPVSAGDGFVDLVEDFQYLGSCINRDGELDKVSGCLSKAAKMFGCLCFLLIEACLLPLRSVFTLLLFL